MTGERVALAGDRARPVAVYLLVAVVGVAAFLYPFWLPQQALPSQAHAADAPLVAAVVGALVVAAVTLEVRRGTMGGTTVAVLGVLSAVGALLRLLDLPGGGSGMFPLVVLGGAALGPRLGLLLGLCSMATSAVITGGIGPWLPFQMLAMGGGGAGAGLVGRVLSHGAVGERLRVAFLAAYGWVLAFAYGAVMNLWFWPFVVGDGPTQWRPGLPLGEALERYRAFYLLTSFGWDAAGALANLVLIAAVGVPVLRSLSRVASRIAPPVELVGGAVDGGGTEAEADAVRPVAPDRG